METKRNILLLFTAYITVLSFISCSTIGQYLPLSPNEQVIGTIQTSFIARDSWIIKKETMNSQAYIKLLEAAAQKYPGEIDIRDIVWVTGRKIGQLDTEVSAIAKVIRIEFNEPKN
jgi:hypothetical protein